MIESEEGLVEYHEVSEVCVETTVVVDTLGPARRRAYGLCVTVQVALYMQD